MVLSASLKTRLLGAIETDSLIFLCGAGLSIPPPSDLLSACKVSQICYDRWRTIEADLNPAYRDDVDRLARHFYARSDFKVFIRLVPWNELVGRPNNGHAAIADLLICRGARAALSTNFDSLIESWAEERKIALQGALTGHDAEEYTAKTNPLIKLHGCIRARDGTLWTQAQLADPAIQARIDSCSQWMSLHLPGKHLVVVGFWTDWSYLNDVLADAFAIDTASSVTVIDPMPAVDLEVKAPNLWAKLNNLSQVFEHVRASGDDALDELRTTFSKAWAQQFFALGRPLMLDDGITVPPTATPNAMTGEDLYKLRRDAQGVPYSRAATWKAPELNAAQTAFVHLKLLSAGATQQGAWLQHGGRSIRVVNGAGQGLASVQARYKEPTTIIQSEIVVCVGAENLGVPGRLIAPGRGASTIRPTPGGDSMWLTLDEAREQLGL